MALTTPAAFNTFKDILLLTDTQKETVSARRNSAHGYLKSSFAANSNMPLSRTSLIGSAGRSTIIRPVDDIDVLAVFENKDNVFDSYRYNSQAFLYRIRDALSGFRVKIVGARGQAVRLFYTAAPHVDIAPVFRWSSGGYALPNGSGGWLTTDPDVHATHMAKRNSELGSNLKPMIRMMKRWNNVHSKRLKSFHLEMLVASSFATLGSDSRAASEVFFGYAKDHLSVSDPAGHSGDLSSYLTWAARSEVMASMESARERASRANAAEKRGDHAEAIRLWRIIFGDELPAYG
jgi:hypothetical protein